MEFLGQAGKSPVPDFERKLCTYLKERMPMRDHSNHFEIHFFCSIIKAKKKKTKQTCEMNLFAVDL
jgi:hypothetical protein